jgi:hypothetical protein
MEHWTDVGQEHEESTASLHQFYPTDKSVIYQQIFQKHQTYGTGGGYPKLS